MHHIEYMMTENNMLFDKNVILLIILIIQWLYETKYLDKIM